MKLRKNGKFMTTHGMSNTPTYISWIAMKQRCLNKNHEKYRIYGGRGIIVCQRWINSFENFYKDMGERPAGKTLDRIENDKGYCKSNCRWATETEQHNNTKRNYIITYKGKTQTMSQWAEELDINYNALRERIRKKWSVEKALTTIVRYKKQN